MKSLRIVVLVVAVVAFVIGVTALVSRAPEPIPDEQKKTVVPSDESPMVEKVNVTQHSVIREAAELPQPDATSATPNTTIPATNIRNAGGITALREALKQDPKNPKTMIELAKELQRQGDYRAANALMRRAMGFDPALRRSPEIRKMMRDIRVNVRRQGIPSRAVKK